MDINKLLLGAFQNAVDNPEIILEGHKQFGTDVVGSGEKKAYNTRTAGKKSKRFGTSIPMSENLSTNLDTKRAEREKKVAPLAVAAGLGAMNARNKMARLKKSTIGVQI